MNGNQITDETLCLSSSELLTSMTIFCPLCTLLQSRWEMGKLNSWVVHKKIGRPYCSISKVYQELVYKQKVYLGLCERTEKYKGYSKGVINSQIFSFEVAPFPILPIIQIKYSSSILIVLIFSLSLPQNLAWNHYQPLPLSSQEIALVIEQYSKFRLWAVHQPPVRFDNFQYKHLLSCFCGQSSSAKHI